MDDRTNQRNDDIDEDEEEVVCMGVARLPPLQAQDIAAEAVAAATGKVRKRKTAINENDENDSSGKAKRKKGSTGTSTTNNSTARGAPAAPTIISFQADPALTNQNKKDGIPPWRKIQDVFLSEESVTLAMIQRGILTVPAVCPKCNQLLRFPKKGAIMRCSKCYSRNGGEWSQSLYKGTFFEFGRMKRQDALLFLYHWLCGAKHKQLSLVMGWSNSTTFRWTALVQALVATVTFYENYNPNPRKKTPQEIAAMEATIVKIGGQDVIVQIDDCPFDKRYVAHPDYSKEGWIFCGVEVTPKHRFFSAVVEDRSPAKFMALARKYIAPGSIIRSTRWTSNDIIDIQANSQYRLEKIINHNTILADHPFMNPFQSPTHHINMEPQQQQQQQQQQQTAGDGELWIIPEEQMPAALPQGVLPSSNNNTTQPMRKHNNVKEIQGSLFEFIWRKQHDMNLWNGILWTLKQVKYQE